MNIPQRTTVLVIGGGPAGSMAATLLAREGVEVTLVERDRFPRYHIGESMLPGVVPLLRFTDVFDEIDRSMIRKYGTWFKIKADLPPGVIEWKDISDSPFSWNVCRATFDYILLQHAERSEAEVFQETTVNSLSRVDDRFVSADWERRDSQRGLIDFEYVIDATGMSGLIATKYHRDRVFQENFGSGWVVSADTQPKGRRPPRHISGSLPTGVRHGQADHLRIGGWHWRRSSPRERFESHNGLHDQPAARVTQDRNWRRNCQRALTGSPARRRRYRGYTVLRHRSLPYPNAARESWYQSCDLKALLRASRIDLRGTDPATFHRAIQGDRSKCARVTDAQRCGRLVEGLTPRTATVSSACLRRR
jgi:2-polyprenyl-6-methoxyphenol hydroxylase-like FAD-dependent oxidoreductase